MNPQIQDRTHTPMDSVSRKETTDRYLSDGFDHINVWSRGKTELGRALSHFAKAHFTHPVFGTFHSMEAYWHWLRSVNRPDHLRHLWGFMAKKAGKEQTTFLFEDRQMFMDLILDGNYHKISQNKDIEQMLVSSKLPFDHYYVYGDEHGGACAHIWPLGATWQIEMFETLRTMFQNNEKPKKIDYTAALRMH